MIYQVQHYHYWIIFDRYSKNSEDHKLYNNLTVEQSSISAINKYVENDLTDADIHDTDGREGKSK